MSTTDLAGSSARTFPLHERTKRLLEAKNSPLPEFPSSHWSVPAQYVDANSLKQSHIDELLRNDDQIVAFDSEWQALRPSDGVCVVQLATASCVLIVFGLRGNNWDQPSTFPLELRRILEDPGIVKAGVNCRGVHVPSTTAGAALLTCPYQRMHSLSDETE